MKMAIVALSLGLLAVSVLFWMDHQKLTAELTRTQPDKALQLASCLSDAEVEYDQKWNGLCAQMGQEDFCATFIGSPKDIQFAQIKNQEKNLCASLYK